MRRFGLFLVGFTFVLSVLLVDVAAVTRSEPTFVGVIGADGLLTPIAVYDGHDWWNRWPWAVESDEIRALPLPRSLASIPSAWLPDGLHFPADWTVLHPSGTHVAVRALSPMRRSGFQMMETIVVRTTFRRNRGEEFEDAAAVAGPGTLGRFVSPSPAEARSLGEQLHETIVKLQQDEIRRWLGERRDLGEPAPSLTRVERVQTPSGVKQVLVAPDAPIEFGLIKADVAVAGNRYYYYLSGSELYAIRAGDDCKMTLSTQGIVVVAEGRVVSHRLASTAYAEFCGDAAEWTTPIAALSLNGKTHWIMRDSVEDGYDYLLFDPDTGDPVLLKGGWSERRQH